jgi:hypothetical protein
MFDDTCFSPIGGQTIKSAPTVYSYRTEIDTLPDVMAPGYFNSKSLLFAPGSIVHVVAVDEIAQVFVKAVEGINVILDDRVIMAQRLASSPVKKKNNNRPQKAA